MSRLFKLQFLGPLALFLSALSAELSAYALARTPTSETLWYLNLKVFGLFQRTHEALGSDVPGFQLYCIVIPIFALACIGLAVRSKLPLAISTQFAAGYAAFLLLAWQSPDPATAQASLQLIAVPSGEGFYMLAGILVACLSSCVISHLCYLWPPRAEA